MRNRYHIPKVRSRMLGGRERLPPTTVDPLVRAAIERFPRATPKAIRDEIISDCQTASIADVWASIQRVAPKTPGVESLFAFAREQSDIIFRSIGAFCDEHNYSAVVRHEAMGQWPGVSKEDFRSVVFSAYRESRANHRETYGNRRQWEVAIGIVVDFCLSVRAIVPVVRGMVDAIGAGVASDSHRGWTVARMLGNDDRDALVAMKDAAMERWGSESKAWT